jgi:hypothetical protein
MSAYEVDDTHIDVLVSAAIAAGKGFYWYHQPAEAPRTEPGEALPGELSGGERYAAYLAGLRDNKREVTRANAGMWGAVLVAENKRSVNHRYDDDEIEDPYEFAFYAGPFDLVAILRALDCYEYQASEHPGWAVSEACEFVNALRRHTIRSLPGYSDGPREVTDVSQVRPAPRTYICSGDANCKAPAGDGNHAHYCPRHSLNQSAPAS